MEELGQLVASPEHFIGAAGNEVHLVARRGGRCRQFQKSRLAMSALPPITDIGSSLRHVRFVPIADITALVRNPWPAQHQIGRA